MLRLLLRLRRIAVTWEVVYFEYLARTKLMSADLSFVEVTVKYILHFMSAVGVAMTCYAGSMTKHKGQQ